MSCFLKEGRVSLALGCVCTLLFTGAHAWGQKVIATIPLDNTPAGVGVDYVAQKVYVAVQSEVEVIDEKDHKVVASFNLPTDWTITDVKPNPATGLIYVAAEGGGLWVLDPKTLFPLAMININAAALAVDPVTNMIYVSDFNNTLCVVDGKWSTLVKQITVDGIQNVAVNPATNRIYVARGLFPGHVEVIDGKTYRKIADPAAGGDLSFDVAVDPVHDLFFSSEQLGTVSIYDGKTNKRTGSVTIKGEPTGIVADPKVKTVYAADYENNDVDVLNEASKRVERKVSVGARTSPEYMDIDPFRGFLYVADSGSNTLKVIKTH
jgi:DNA-binding beta-propeller fold protein YncE